MATLEERKAQLADTASALSEGWKAIDALIQSHPEAERTLKGATIAASELEARLDRTYALESPEFDNVIRLHVTLRGAEYNLRDLSSDSQDNADKFAEHRGRLRAQSSSSLTESDVEQIETQYAQLLSGRTAAEVMNELRGQIATFITDSTPQLPPLTQQITATATAEELPEIIEQATTIRNTLDGFNNTNLQHRGTIDAVTEVMDQSRRRAVGMAAPPAGKAARTEVGGVTATDPAAAQHAAEAGGPPAGQPPAREHGQGKTGHGKG